MANAAQTNRDAVLAAVAEFDSLGRETFLNRYGFKPARTYFLEYDGREYDSKAIVGVAYGYANNTAALAPKDFSGGDAAAANVLRRLGFTVVRHGVSLPDWTTDELIVALDYYLRVRDGEQKDSPQAIAEISALLRSLPLFSDEVRSDPTFRNGASVKLKVANFRALDPAYSGSGMTHGAASDARVWDEWSHRPDALKSVAAAIRGGGSSPEMEQPADEEDEFGAQEGRLLYRRHRARERDRRLVKRKKEQVLKQTGRLACEVCDFEPSTVFGPELADLFDVHHVRPLAESGTTRTTLADLALLCPTCHRAIHRQPVWTTPSALRQSLHAKGLSPLSRDIS
jgi:5-methylcytosine-specific restriction protein A